LKGEVEGGGVKKVSKGKRRWRWTEERIVKFKGRMEDWWEEKGDGKEIKWEIVKEGVRNILEEEQGKEGGWKKGWWDQECREEKRRVRRELRRWRRRRGGGERYRELRGVYNKLCERKKREESERWEEIIRNAKTERQVWEVVNRERKRKRGIEDGIKMED